MYSSDDFVLNIILIIFHSSTPSLFATLPLPPFSVSSVVLLTRFTTTLTSVSAVLISPSSNTFMSALTRYVMFLFSCATWTQKYALLSRILVIFLRQAVAAQKARELAELFAAEDAAEAEAVEVEAE